MVKILVFGDSIAWGAFDNEFGGWTERLKTHFLKNYEEKGIGVYNLSVSSNDTRGVLEFLEQDIKKIAKIEPEKNIFIFSIGSNDPRYMDKQNNVVVPKKEFEENLKKIINISKKHSKKIIFTGLMGVDEKLTLPWTDNEYWENAGIEAYDSIIQRICEQEKIEFIPLIDLIDKTELHDGLHPNTKGHEKIFERIKKYLEKEI